MAICQLTEELCYYICRRPVDMRKQITGLQGIVTSSLGRYPVAGEAYIFMGKNRQTVKILHREGNGLTMYVRKLNRGGFKMPEFSDSDESPCILDYRTFRMLIMGDISDLQKRGEKYVV